MSDLIGKTINDYEFQELIGHGGHGIVYKAWQESVNRTVAIKVILPENASNEDFIHRFETEAKVIGQLEHANIVPLYHYWRDESGMYIVTRWFSHGTARKSIDETGGWPSAHCERLVVQISDALAEAHEAGVVHRDVKPGNILLDSRDNCYLGDFGIAKRLHDNSHITDPSHVVGSPAYLTPEQILGEPVTPQTDVYGLGITIYEVLTGEHPYANTDLMRMVIKQLQDPVPSIRARRPDLPPAVNDVIQRATAKRPGERYKGVLDLAQAYKEALKRD